MQEACNLLVAPWADLSSEDIFSDAVFRGIGVFTGTLYKRQRTPRYTWQ